MKVKASIKRLCEACRIVKRRGRLYVVCKENRKHKQRQGYHTDAAAAAAETPLQAAAAAGRSWLDAGASVGVRLWQGALGWRRDRLRAFPELRFTYEEEAHPEEFFLPYVWSLVVAQAGGVPWNLGAIALFRPTLLREGSGVGPEQRLDSAPASALVSPQTTLAESGSLPAHLVAPHARRESAADMLV